MQAEIWGECVGYVGPGLQSHPTRREGAWGRWKQEEREGVLPLQSQHVTPCPGREIIPEGDSEGVRGEGPTAATGPGICPSPPNSLNLEQFPLFPSNRETPRGWGRRPLHRSEAVSTGSTGSANTCRRDPQAGTPRGSQPVTRDRAGLPLCLEPCQGAAVPAALSLVGEAGGVAQHRCQEELGESHP